jgi:chromosome segregation protein
LEIKGFKSFADNTEINLEPGINIIVGPNGCGKSNIVDAIRWVLGESNVRHLRGNKNEDVIFNGTDKKKALGMAQVAMTVDNSDGSLPLEYGEVTVSRKIFRSGESEFYLNKSRVRMKDIVNLYTDTGLGRRGYSIISQGELERVLNGQAFDRRLMLEEAAGTIKYRQQRDEVQQRLSTSNQDLIRVRDILNELEIRKLELHSKAEKASVYISAWDEYQVLEKQVMASQIIETTNNLFAKREELTYKHDNLGELTSKLDHLYLSKQQAEKYLEEKRAELNILKESKYEIEAQLNRMDSEMKLSQERIKNYRERITVAGNDSEKYALMLENLQKDLEIKFADFNREKEQYLKRRCEVEQLQEDISKLEVDTIEQENLFEQNRKLVFERVNKEAEIKNEITSLENRINRAQEKKERLLIRVEENEKKLSTTKKSIVDLSGLRMQQWKHKEELEKLVLDAGEQKSECFDSLARIEKEYKNISQDIIKLEHRLMALMDLQKSYAGFSEGVRSIMQYNDRGEPRLRGMKGVVANLIEIPPGMELAIDVAIGKGMENIVMETANSAQMAIRFLKEKRMGRVTFLPLDVLRVQKVPARLREEILAGEGVLGLASELLQYAPEYEKAIAYLLGRVLLVQDMDCGLRIFKRSQYPLRIVSLEGELINASGALTGGTHAQAKSSPLQRKREQKNISQQLEDLRQSENQNRESAGILSGQLKVADDNLVQAKNGLAEVEFQLKMIREEEQRLQVTLESSLRDKEIYLSEISQLEIIILQSEADILSLQDCYSSVQEENQQVSDEIERIKAELEINRREYEVRKERFSSHQEQLIMKQKELENIEKNIGQFEQVKDSYHQSGLEALELQLRLQKEVDVHHSRVENTAEKVVEKKQELKIIVESIVTASNDEKELNTDLEAINNSAKPLQQEIIDIQEQIRAMEMRVVRIETELEGLQGQWKEKFNSETSEIFGDILSLRQTREYRTRIENLKEQIELLGPVDIEAIKEYDNIRIRYDFLYQQSQDLSIAIVSLEKLLQETEKIMAKNFSQFMELANASFNNTFMEIFNGGDAGLMIESTRDLNAGVELMVKMPGKRSQSLNLLSGGERALTCIAFIFSLLRLKPVPFCLLDEIDAALDEINLTRFADFLRGMSGDTQFIVITHRQGTIEAGGNIYGITMPQEGISSVLSIQCHEIQSLAG